MRGRRRTVLSLTPTDVGTLGYLLKKQRELEEQYLGCDFHSSRQRESIEQHIVQITTLEARLEAAFERSLLPPKCRTVSIKADRPLDEKALKRILGGR